MVLGGVYVLCLGGGGGAGLPWGMSKAAEVTQTWTGLESLISKEQAVVVVLTVSWPGVREVSGGLLRGMCMKFAVLFRRCGERTLHYGDRVNSGLNSKC